MDKQFEEVKVSILGLGYVGLPLLIAFCKKGFKAVGFDTNRNRINELRMGIDKTKEAEPEELRFLKNASLTFDEKLMHGSDIFIVTVPTPLMMDKSPDLTPLKEACISIGKQLQTSNTVIFESTVYPGATEEFCVPILEETSNLKFNTDFFCGFSPERINPGDSSRKLENIVKVVSGSTPETLELVNELYSKIIEAGTHKAESIKIAEAAKIIENTQRDLNIALMNELSMMFKKLNIDTKSVLNAASTKWNFLPFQPGLVGGHCIGVDPYYLTHKAMEIDFNPQVILAGRSVNDTMFDFVAQNVKKLVFDTFGTIANKNLLILGATFKKNCPDLRNSQVFYLHSCLVKMGFSIVIHDSLAENSAMVERYSSDYLEKLPFGAKFDAVILAVDHSYYLNLGIKKLQAFRKPDGLFFDVNSAFPPDASDWRL